MTKFPKTLNVANAVPQEALPPFNISVEDLVAKRDRFLIKPKYQREVVWNLRQTQQYIDSLLLGDPSPPFEGYEGFNGAGIKTWEIGDGQNRMHAIIGFVLGEFKTWTAAQKKIAEPCSTFGPVEPNKYFEELSTIAKNYLLGYMLRIDRLRDRDESERATRFLRMNIHVPLSAAEKLRVYTSKAKTIAETISQHDFWEDFYEGKTHRGQLFQSSLYLLALELSPNGIGDLQGKGFIHSLASGKYDNKITNGIVDAILARLDDVVCLYSGGHFTVRAAIIAMYQSSIFLDRAGYSIHIDDKGKLTSWLESIIANSNRSSGIPSYNRPLQSLTGSKAQRKFWQQHMSTMMAYMGVNGRAMEKLMA